MLSRTFNNQALLRVLVVVVTVLYGFVSYADKNKWQYNAGSEYDAYYDGYNESMHNKLFRNRYIPFDRWVIEDEINRAIQKKETITVMDFGAGSGRHFFIYQEVAEQLKSQNKKIKLIAYDISKKAMISYQMLLKDLGYKLINDDRSNKNCVVRRFEKDNFVVDLVYTLTNISIKDLSKVISKVDLTFCMYGVLGHIQTKKGRISALKDLANLTHDKIFLEVAGDRAFSEGRKAFDFIRNNKINIQINCRDVVLEKGDIIYARNYQGKHIENYYHIYESADEIIDEVKESGHSVDGKVAINKLSSEGSLIAMPVLGKIDMYLSRLFAVILPQSIKDKIVSYYFVRVKVTQ
jgi:hypothetical protein